ncbi:MAG TPA: hypothetical protein VGA08_01290 [Candidatus Saccharimonadales bacterium]
MADPTKQNKQSQNSDGFEPDEELSPQIGAQVWNERRVVVNPDFVSWGKARDLTVIRVGEQPDWKQVYVRVGKGPEVALRAWDRIVVIAGQIQYGKLARPKSFDTSRHKKI